MLAVHACLRRAILGTIALSTALCATLPSVAHAATTTAKITSPSSGATVSGTITISATAQSSAGIGSVQLRVDDVWVQGDSSAPYSFRYDTSKLANGSHTITVVAWDKKSSSGTASVKVTKGTTTTPPPPPPPTPPTASTLTGPATGAWLGASVENGSQALFETFAKNSGRDLDALRTFSRDGDSTLLTDYAKARLDAGKIVVASWKPSESSSNRYTWQQVTNGAKDSEITKMCAPLAALGIKGHRLFVSFHHEPDTSDDASRGSNSEYAKAFRHVRDVCRSAGATNVRWIWIVTNYKTNRSKYGAADNDLSNGMYPGNDAVDWIGFDIYGQSGCGKTFRDTMQQGYDWALANGYGSKPIAITETGITDNSCKAAWFRSIPAGLAALPGIKMVLYFNLDWSEEAGAGHDYRIEATSTAIAGWKEAATNSLLRQPIPQG